MYVFYFALFFTRSLMIEDESFSSVKCMPCVQVGKYDHAGFFGVKTL